MDQEIALLLPRLARHASLSTPRVDVRDPFVSCLKAHCLEFTDRLIGCAIATKKLHKANHIPMCSTPIPMNTAIEMRFFSGRKHGKTICPLTAERTRTAFVNDLP